MDFNANYSTELADLGSYNYLFGRLGMVLTGSQWSLFARTVDYLEVLKGIKLLFTQMDFNRCAVKYLFKDLHTVVDYFVDSYEPFQRPYLFIQDLAENPS